MHHTSGEPIKIPANGKGDNAMIAEAKDLDLPDSSSIQVVNVTVDVTLPEQPGKEPLITFTGLDTKESVWIKKRKAEFLLDLVVVNPEAGSATFDPAGPVDWRTPGKEEPIEQPKFITDVKLSGDNTTLTFNNKNNATKGKDIIVSFAVVLSYTTDGVGMESFSSHVPAGGATTFPSPDPTIINVDPPDSMS
jgi:hypothetical protein